MWKTASAVRRANCGPSFTPPHLAQLGTPLAPQRSRLTPEWAWPTLELRPRIGASESKCATPIAVVSFH